MSEVFRQFRRMAIISVPGHYYGELICLTRRECNKQNSPKTPAKLLAEVRHVLRALQEVSAALTDQHQLTEVQKEQRRAVAARR